LGLNSIRKSESGKLLVADCTKKRLEEINEVSRQLLSRILAMQTDSQVFPQEHGLKNTKIQSIDDENKELTELTEKRQLLITDLFEQNTADSISSESELLQEMIALDSELTANAKLSKQAITEQMIKIKKSKKVTKSYQKY
jgi:hypothetical protein